MEQIIKKVNINAPAEKVWQAIINAELLAEWTAMPNNFKPELGYKFEFQADPEGKHGKWDRIIRCKITELIQYKKLSFTWQFELMAGETLVTFELLGKKDFTELTLIHSGFECDAEKGGYWKEISANGWRDLLSRLNHMVTEKKNIKHIADIALFSPGKTLLMKYTDTNKYDLQNGWFIPDDALNHGEHPEDAVIRILKEQLGIDGITPKFGFIESFIGGDKSWHLVFHYYITVDENIKLSPIEDVAVIKWFDLNSLPDRREVAHNGWGLFTIEELLNKGIN